MKLTYIKIINKNGEFLTGGKRFVSGGPGSFDVRHFCYGKRSAIKVFFKNFMKSPKYFNVTA